MNPIEILAIDDEPEMLGSYQKILKKAGYIVHCALTADQALEILQKNPNISLIISDLRMPGIDGLTLLEQLRREFPMIPVIMVTGYGTLELGIEAVKKGAFDFIEKPFSSRKLLGSIKDALNQIVAPNNFAQNEGSFDNMVGQSAAMRQVFEMIRKVSYGNANVLITGESGVGKELVARSIHKHSLRRNHPIIPINCGALPDQLFESELFGYEKGAFTGAFQSKPGLIELANGGTLFLDEVCELPQHLQVKLLRALEERKIRRIGGQKEIPVNIRVVSATNRDLNRTLKEGWLREDFFYRINTIQIHIPPLRERREDIPLLIKHFLRELNQKYNREILDLDKTSWDLVHQYSWPGNVRELQNVIERAYYLANPPIITLSDFPHYLLEKKNEDCQVEWQNLSYREAKEEVLRNFERNYLTYHLERNNWNISRTAEICGIDRRTIHRLIKKYGIQANQKDASKNL